MTNVREVILPRDKRKDGTWYVKIRVTHQRKVKYISTSLYVTEKHIRKDFTIKDPTILRALNPTLDDLRAKIADLGIKLEVYSLDRLLKCLEGNEVVDAEGIDVIGLGRNRVKELKEAGRDGSAGNLTTVLNGLVDFFGTEVMPVTEIRAKMLTKYAGFLSTERKITRLDQFGKPVIGLLFGKQKKMTRY